MTDQENQVFVGGDPTPEELMYFDIGEQFLKDSLPNLNQTIRQLVMLDAGTLGGAIAISDKPAIAHWAISLTLPLLFLALITAVIGLIPYHADVSRNEPYEVRRHLFIAIKRKGRIVRASVSFLLAALGVMVLGVLFR